MRYPFALPTHLPLLLRFVAVLALAGCGDEKASGRAGTGGAGDTGGVSSGGAGSAGSAGAGESVNSPTESRCVSPEPSELAECSSGSGAPLILARASDVLEGGRFVAIGGGAALVEGNGAGIERYRVIQMRFDLGPLGEPPALVRSLRWDEAVGDVEVVGVLGYSLGFNPPALDSADATTIAVTALACDTNGCTLLAASTAEEDEDELAPIPDAPLPEGIRPLGFTGDRWQLCATTETELYCNDGGGWYLAAEPDPPSRFRQVEVAAAFGMAVTEDGRLWVRREGPWAEEVPGFEGPVERVNVSDWGVVAIGRAGELAIDFGSAEPDWQFLCTEASPLLWARVAYSSTPGISFALMADGSALRLDSSFLPPPWCFLWQLDLEAYVGAGIDTCRGSNDTILMTESLLIAAARPYCAIY